MSDFTIEKNVPIPIQKRRCKYPWHELEIGDSFFVSEIKVISISSSANSYGTRTGKKFTIRSVDGGCRVWRIA